MASKGSPFHGIRADKAGTPNSLTYANTDGAKEAARRCGKVQESKHAHKPGIHFAKLKDMRERIFWKFALAVVASAGVALISGPLRLAAGPQASKTAAKPEESALAHEIRHQILVLPYYSVFDYITFTLEGSKVTLRGEVLRPTLRAHAEAAVRSIEGILTVENQIVVLPKSSTDDDLRRAVYRAVFEDSVLQRYAVDDVPRIHIIVKDGAVALEGGVETESDKSLAGTRASSVPGISGVRNDLFLRVKTPKGN
jgi:hyperosmotically inducible periplasmic protein